MPSLLSSLLLLPAPLLAAQSILYSPDNYQFDPLEHLAGIAPYFDPQDPPLDPSAPQGCNVTRAAYLIRHAAIYANDFDYESYIEPFVSKLQNTTVDWTSSPSLAFLSTWTTPIETSDEEKLTKIGMLEGMSLGVELARRYESFAPPQKVWSSTAERTVKTAQSFISGVDRTSNMSTLIQVSESEEAGADSLTPYEGCPAYSSSRGSSQSSTFQKKYTAPIIARFHAEIPGFNWTASDIYAMQELCGYDSVIRGASPFCSLDLFTPDEWLAFEYTNDIMYFHNTGYGNEISPVIGFPWLNATTQQLLSDDSSDAQDLYASFTHRELPPTVLVALGLFNNSAFSGANDPNATMPLDAINHRRAWKSSHILPFLTNVAIEKMSCDSYGFASTASDEYYRVLVNSSPQPLPGCSDGPGESCARADFESFVKERGEMYGGFSEKCGVEYTNSTDVLGIYESA
ncbi:phosphoglycerate mutase-like protein [Saccharata proteae CBS 121410]|uniref:Phosphoglycerate mutase-like protein n=1 Tax=Saccharata proteae CBS 121410 TaxID=1314787 RepID=A0A9P4HUZ6_9PEZI|nr:phosphoglycerate mutase-like protein [Saccharata proteae CBS 121410]